jgi:hypothetical protein
MFNGAGNGIGDGPGVMELGGFWTGGIGVGAGRTCLSCVDQQLRLMNYVFNWSVCLVICWDLCLCWLICETYDVYF